ncbi:hypothetical protein OR1_03627 [Geobacter sp. OR-1]|uniref:DUF927 domain-containing protein n=1 Tax=Geobacter sp. OR-1 TaxID=1266765 RepID=UPI000542066D|nr:DUF927 domain-containing protein [Geobacter sp. OR-1]GAM11314.1 hypothetical protein OR1_03627 [Geobacter sp. OR-1]
MSQETSKRKLPGGFFAYDDGDLTTLDKSGGEIIVVEGGYVQAEAMSHLEGSVEWSVHHSHKDFDGKKHSTTHTVADMHTSPKQVIRKFLAHGLRLLPNTSKIFMFFLLSNLPSKRFLRVLRTGWLENSWIYIQPHWQAGDSGEPIHLEIQGTSPTIASMTSSGRLKEWQCNVAEPLRGNALAMFCLIFSFLGPLLKVLGMDGGGVNLMGGSSVGKTTGLQIAASTYGCGCSPASDSGKSYLQQWNLTSNAIEGIAAAHTDALTALDEVGLYAGNDLGSDLYLLAGGRGKGAMDSQRRLKNVSSWRGNIISSGEMGMVEAIERKGGRAKAGMLVRLIDIPITNMFPNPPKGMTSGEFSGLIKSRCATYYGTAGRAFLNFLVAQLQDDPEEVIADLRAAHEEFTREMIPATATPLQERAIRRFAAVRIAGHAAVEAKVLPYTIDEIDECVAEVVDTWLTYRPTVTDVQRSLVQLQDFLVRTGASLPTFSETQAANPKGFRDSSRQIFAFTDSQLAAACTSSNIIEVAKELRRQKFLFCNEGGRLKAKLRISSGQETRFYCITKSFLTADLQKNDADASVTLESGSHCDDDDDDI